jgi:hypothetical protein
MYYRVFLIILIFLSGCTSQLWKTPGYHEKVTGFFGVKGKDLLIVTGQKYSYVFEASQQFKDVLTVSRTTEFDSRFKNFKLDKDNNITGSLSLVAYKPTNINKLTELGFVQTKYDSMKIEFELIGKRYIVEGSFPFEKLEDNHFVLVETPESGVAKAGKIVATPAAVTIDAMAVIPMGAMFAILGVMNELDM